LRTLKIKIKYINKELPKIESIAKGDWIDLRSAIELCATFPEVINGKVFFQSCEIPLNVCMQLPKYYEANIVPRSSTFKNFGMILCNSFGVIDNTYCGDGDQWYFGAIFLKECKINQGDRIAQFRINLSQKAPWYIKLKWLFTSKIKFLEVETLENENRGGMGSSGRE